MRWLKVNLKLLWRAVKRDFSEMMCVDPAKSRDWKRFERMQKESNRIIDEEIKFWHGMNNVVKNHRAQRLADERREGGSNVAS